jgi:hypothetical protein
MLTVTLLSDEGGLVRAAAHGPISQTRFRSDANPLEGVLGPTGYARKVLLSLEGTDYIDSSGISWLIVNHKHFQQAGGLLVLYALPPRVKQVLEFTRMNTVLRLADDEPAARALAHGEARS